MIWIHSLASGWSLVRKKHDDLAVQYEDVHGLTHNIGVIQPSFMYLLKMEYEYKITSLGLNDGEKGVLTRTYNIIYVLAPVEKLVAWKTENQMSCAELWIEFFEHYSLGIMSTDNIISVRSTANCTKEDRQWKGKKMAIEDPFSTKRSLTR